MDGERRGMSVDKRKQRMDGEFMIEGNGGCGQITREDGWRVDDRGKWRMWGD